MAKKVTKRVRLFDLSDLGEVPMPVLQHEMKRRARLVRTLSTRRQHFAQKIDALDLEMAKIGGKTRDLEIGGESPTAHGQNGSTLPEALTKALKGGVQLSVTQLAEKVQASGYKSKSKTFRTIVNQALIKHRQRFRKVGRGVYAAK